MENLSSKKEVGIRYLAAIGFLTFMMAYINQPISSTPVTLCFASINTTGNLSKYKPVPRGTSVAQGYAYECTEAAHYLRHYGIVAGVQGSMGYEVIVPRPKAKDALRLLRRHYRNERRFRVKLSTLQPAIDIPDKEVKQSQNQSGNIISSTPTKRKK